jgi:hypothetical protein
MGKEDDILEEAVASIKLIELGFEVRNKEGVKQTKESILQSLVEQGLIEPMEQ